MIQSVAVTIGIKCPTKISAGACTLTPSFVTFNLYDLYQLYKIKNYLALKPLQALE